MRVGAIVNPASGSGKMKKIWNQNRELIKTRLENVHTFLTSGKGEATKIARSLAQENYEVILVGGGDGTLHEVVNGLLDENGEMISSETKLALLNGGTGADFLKSLHIPSDVHEAIDIIREGKIKKVDVGRIRVEGKASVYDTFYINSSSIGLGGGTATRINASSSRWLPSSIKYLKAGLQEHISYSPEEIRVSVGGTPVFEGIAQNVFVCNGRYSGGGMYWAPEALLDDGMFDILLCKPISIPRLVPALKNVYAGKVQELPEVTFYKGQEVRIQLKREEPIEVDGEVYHGSDFTYRCLTQKLSVLVP